jgi:hypothetical protein
MRRRQARRSDRSVTPAQFDLATPDFNGVGQENVGAGEVNLHCWLKLVASWFETRGVAALLTMRVQHLFPA